MGDVGIGHEIVVVADDRDPGPAWSVARWIVDEFPEDVPVADPDPGRLALVPDVLRLAADGDERGKPVVRSDLGPAADRERGIQDGSRPDDDFSADDAKRADLDAGERRARPDERRPSDELRASLPAIKLLAFEHRGDHVPLGRDLARRRRPSRGDSRTGS